MSLHTSDPVEFSVIDRTYNNGSQHLDGQLCHNKFDVLTQQMFRVGLL